METSSNSTSLQRDKDNVFGWIKEFPEHWEVKPALSVLAPIKNKNYGLKENTVLSLSYGKIVVKPPEKLRGLVPESFESYQIINPGDIVIRTTDLQNDQTSLRVGISKNRGIITSAYLSLSCNEKIVLSEYAYQFLNSWDLTKAIYGYGSGLRQNLEFTHIKRMPILIPPLGEQKNIVLFLDKLTKIVDETIKAKRRELQLVTEILLSTTHKAISHPDTKAMRISSVADLVSRPIDKTSTKSYVPIGVYNRGRGIFHKPATEAKDLGASDFFWVKKGDLIISGQFAWEGAVAMASDRDDGCIASHRYPILQANPKYLSSGILAAILRTDYGTMLFDSHSRGAAGRNRPLNISTFIKEKIPIPPISQQAQILEIMEKERQISQSLAHLVQLLNEYRARLIYDAVTGKIDCQKKVKELNETQIESFNLSQDDFENHEEIEDAE